MYFVVAYKELACRLTALNNNVSCIDSLMHDALEMCGIRHSPWRNSPTGSIGGAGGDRPQGERRGPGKGYEVKQQCYPYTERKTHFFIINALADSD